MNLVLVLLFAVSVIIGIRIVFLERDIMKLRQRNKLLCRENHRLRIKLQENENSSKG